MPTLNHLAADPLAAGHLPGISGMAVYVPGYRIALRDWCQWYGQPWEKVAHVVGDGFRMPHPQEDVYCMAASAALRLIQQYQIDPRRVGMLALGTESSKDNAAGAVIVRGLIDQGLAALGLPQLSRHCEVPEYKHACLAGLYAAKGAIRYLAMDADERQVAIVVAADVAEYARGSSGEQTQGAGAVAMLVDREAKLFTMDLRHSGVASAYRGPDFRKPLARHFTAGYATDCQRPHDFPVFSGRYSTYAYMDATLCAVRALWQRLQCDPMPALRAVDGLFFHRPYAHMPVQGLAMIYLAALHHSGRLDELADLARQNDVALNQVSSELQQQPDLFASVQDNALHTLYPATIKLAAGLRRTAEFKHFQQEKLHLGAALTRELGNLYTASLPSWLAAGMEDALEQGADIAGRSFWAVGYGSGDAAEAIPLTIAPHWREAADKIGFRRALAGAQDLSQAEYEALHDYAHVPAGGKAIAGQPPIFRIQRFGEHHQGDFQDLGVPYYCFNARALQQKAA